MKRSSGRSNLLLGRAGRLSGMVLLVIVLSLLVLPRTALAAPDPPIRHAVQPGETVAAIAAQYGLVVSDVAPVTEGYVNPGSARVVITRSKAYVPNCPNWEHRSASNFANKSWSGYGCAINGNLAAMVADPEHLINGAKGTGETVVMSSTKAIESYRNQAPSGAAGLKQNATN